jgi:hypothetical protein
MLVSPIALLLICCAAPALAAPPDANEPVPPPGLALLVKAQARGVQIYECHRTGPGTFAWLWMGPEATLYNEHGAYLGTHFSDAAARLAWQWGDSSQLVAPRPAQAAQADAWYGRVSAPAQGLLSQVRTVHQQVTQGSRLRDTACSADAAGRELRLPFEAWFRFYDAR